MKESLTIAVCASGASLTLGTPPLISGQGSSLFMRGFQQVDNVFYCRRPGTYKFTLSMRVSNLAAPANLTMQVIFNRANTPDTRRFVAQVSNTDAVTVGNFQPTYTGFVDLLVGDFFYVETTVSSVAAATIQGMSIGTNAAGGVELVYRPTYLYLEQIDLSSPA